MPRIEYIPFSELLNTTPLNELSYVELLGTLEWRNFRNNIIDRDGKKCTRCKAIPNTYMWELKNSSPNDIYGRKGDDGETIYSSKHVVMNVHHKYYIKGKLPWEYKSNALITVCSDCHMDIHENEVIVIYENEQFLKSSKTTNCNKCKESGYLPEYHYNQEGICFECGGKGILENLI